MIRIFILLVGCLVAKESANGRIQLMPPEVDHTIWDGNNISTVHGNHGDVGDAVNKLTTSVSGKMILGR